MSDVWTYRPEMKGDKAVVGFEVEATDGHIGRIDEASDEVGRSYIVVDTGFWIFGKKRVIPASSIQRVDLADEKVHLNLTKDQVKDAPDFDDTAWGGDDAYRTRVGEYYRRF